MEQIDFGICNRTVAVSKGYFTNVLTVETADPETNPDIDSFSAAEPLLLLAAIRVGGGAVDCLVSLLMCLVDNMASAFDRDTTPQTAADARNDPRNLLRVDIGGASTSA